MTVSGDASEMVTTSGQILTIIQYWFIKKDSYHDEKATQNEEDHHYPSLGYGTGHATHPAQRGRRY